MQVGTPKLEQVYILDTQTSQPKVFKNSVSTGAANTQKIWEM